MAWKRVKDVVVKTGEYESNGETKGRFENVGTAWKSDDGGFMVTLKRTFNPAGVPNPEGRDTVMLSFYDIKESNGGGKQQPQRQQSKPQRQQPQEDMDDGDIPF